MSMVVEEHNQHKIGLKRISSEEIMEKRGEDRISTLPDCLLIEILSRLPCTNDAIRTGTISKRWKHLWTWVPTLIFSSVVDNRRHWSRSYYVQFIDKTLTQCRQSKLKKFEVFTGYDRPFESHFHNWIRYAISCNVEEVKLTLWNTTLRSAFQLDQIFYISSCFTHLRLTGCRFSPNGAISWKNLRNLCISHAILSEDLIENILSGSPVLETLALDYCCGYKLLNINSKSVKNLVFSGYYDPEAVYDDVDNNITINAPNILSLAIQKALVLRKILLINVSSLVEAELDYKKRGHCYKETEDETLEGLIVNLCHVKKLKIGYDCFKAASRLEAEGFVFPSNIKFVERRN